MQSDAGPDDGRVEEDLAGPGGGETEDGAALASDAAPQSRHATEEWPHCGSRYFDVGGDI